MTAQCGFVYFVQLYLNQLIKRNIERDAKRFGANLVCRGCTEQGHSSLTLLWFVHGVLFISASCNDLLLNSN